MGFFVDHWKFGCFPPQSSGHTERGSRCGLRHCTVWASKFWCCPHQTLAVCFICRTAGPESCAPVFTKCKKSAPRSAPQNAFGVARAEHLEQTFELTVSHCICTRIYREEKHLITTSVVACRTTLTCLEESPWWCQRADCTAVISVHPKRDKSLQVFVECCQQGAKLLQWEL